MNKKASWLFWVCATCTIAAIGTHVYLTNHHYNFKYGQVAAESVCNISSTVNCNRTTASPYSEVWGVPISILGGLTNLFFLFLLLVWRFPLAKPETQKSLVGPIRLMALGIFGTSVVMGILSYVVLHTICPACSGAYVLSLVSLVTAWMMTEKTTLFSVSHLKIYAGMAVFVLAFGKFIHHDTLKGYGGQERLEIMQLQLDEWKKAPEKNFTPIEPLTMNASKGAKMKIVEFADFLCGHCAMAYPVIHEFVKAHPDVEFSFQAWPLDGECNKAIGHSEGTRCMLARVSHCAGKQEVPWKTQEWIFKNQRNLMSKDLVEKGIADQAAIIGFNKDEMMACVNSDEAREAIRGQANVGTDLNIRGTPSLYINGKKVPSGFSIPLLEMIYQEITR